MLIWIELTVAAALILIAFARPAVGQHWFERTENGLTQLAQHKHLSLVVVGLASLALRLAVLPLLPIPAPTVDDEFDYLLQADTFLHGRLTNPPHPMWTHFETFHVNMLPTYHAKFPPAQGAVIAAGKLIGGYPIVGVWLSMAAMCMAICWMLQEWISPEWALAGGLLLAVRLSAFSYWGNSYWGGAVAATGGALLLGALARMKNGTRTRDALLMGLGIAILANSRPYEGVILCIPVSASLLYWWSRKKGPDLALVLRRAIIPLTLCVALTCGMMAYYNWRLTGRALLLPYQLNEQTYFVSPIFIFQKARPEPVYRHAALRDFYLTFDLPQYQQTQSVRGLLASWYDRYQKIWLVLLGPLLTLPLLLALFTKPHEPRIPKNDWRSRFLSCAGLISIACLSVEVYGLPHYAAPATAILMAVVLLAMRRMRGLHFRGKASGLFLSRAIPLACLLMFTLRAAAAPLGIDVDSSPWPPTWYNSDTNRIPRTDYEQMLQALPGRQLVLVVYRPDQEDGTAHEWVYNAADIDSAKIVWAWDMGAAKNKELLDYFKDRQVFRVSMDGTPISPTPSDAPPAR